MLRIYVTIPRLRIPDTGGKINRNFAKTAFCSSVVGSLTYACLLLSSLVLFVGFLL